MIFNSINSELVIRYIEETYGTEPEFLWAKYPDDAVFRHSNNKKWFAAMLKVEGNKLGLSSSEKIEILDVKCEPMLIDGLTGSSGYLPGYHMNKKYWLTVLLDGTVPISNIYGLIDMSYKLTSKKMK